MAQDDTRVEETLTDEATQLKKRARRRLIGAAALALFAAIILPMVMDTQPAPPLKDIQVRIPSPDEGLTQNIATTPGPAVAKPVKTAPAETPRPIVKPEPAAKPVTTTEKPETEPAPKVPPAVTKVEAEEKRAQEALSGVTAAEYWEVQLGAYQSQARVNNLVGKLKQLGVPTYIEKVETASGPRTRVRAGPFPNREAAEKARARIKIVGVDGPVAQKP